MLPLFASLTYTVFEHFQKTYSCDNWDAIIEVTDVCDLSFLSLMNVWNSYLDNRTTIIVIYSESGIIDVIVIWNL